MRSRPASPRSQRATCSISRDLGEDRPRASHDIASGRRDDQFAAAPLDQPHTERAFEFADLHRERWLADIHRGGSAAEMRLIGERHQVAQLTAG